MTHFRKSQKELLAKLSITALNEMQEEVLLAIASVANTVFYLQQVQVKPLLFYYQPYKG